MTSRFAGCLNLEMTPDGSVSLGRLETHLQMCGTLGLNEQGHLGRQRCPVPPIVLKAGRRNQRRWIPCVSPGQ
jgi:hypothetical protein